ncbi:MAG: flagellar protein export ATPase FliI [Candidimonas sp.]|nr:MAG: flagellar protein export ATPase FliI [Candidimonas sp.]
MSAGTVLGRRWRAQLQAAALRLDHAPVFESNGRITRAAGIVLEVVGLRAPVGTECLVRNGQASWVGAQVVGFQDGKLFLMPQDDIAGLQPGAEVVRRRPEGVGPVRLPVLDAGGDPIPEAESSVGAGLRLPVGEALLGRVLDATGRPIDGLGTIAGAAARSLMAEPINPLQRAPIDTPLDVGIRAINGLLSIGRGQRMGLFAGSGVGKSVLLGMMARYTAADVVIVGLIGERGREVKEFIEQNLGEEGLARSVVVAAPADVSPLLRLQGAIYATRLAEHFRDQGRHVLLIMDSLTRFAMAQREIALAIGEPPATKGYPPSVFARLPRLVERVGNGAQSAGHTVGSITAFYTVLTEGDDPQDPIADAARAILDGHIVLARSLAESGHYPAIDIEASISRVMYTILPQTTMARVHAFKQQLSLYQRNHDLIAVGAYTQGADPAIDRALERYPLLAEYLRQPMNERVDWAQSRTQLEALFAQGEST